MARGIQGTNVITKSNLILPINNLSSGNLAVVEEKLEAEDMASKLEEAERRALDLSDELKLALSEKEKVRNNSINPWLIHQITVFFNLGIARASPSVGGIGKG